MEITRWITTQISKNPRNQFLSAKIHRKAILRGFFSHNLSLETHKWINSQMLREPKYFWVKLIKSHNLSLQKMICKIESITKRFLWRFINRFGVIILNMSQLREDFFQRMRRLWFKFSWISRKNYKGRFSKVKLCKKIRKEKIRRLILEEKISSKIMDMEIKEINKGIKTLLWKINLFK